MDCRRSYFIKLLFIFICTVECMNIFQPKYFCGPLLSDTLKKYNCIYHEITRSMEYLYESGIAKDCCFNRCSIYDLVKSYCSHSDLDSIPNNLLTTPKSNEILSKKLYPTSEDDREVVAQKDVLKSSSQRQQHKTSRSEVSKKSSKKRKSAKSAKKGRNTRKITNRKNGKLKRNSKRDCACSCLKTRSTTNNKKAVLKSPVVGLTNFSRNSVIRLAGIQNNHIFRI